MILPPREPQSGDKITANWARDVVRYIKAITPLPGPGTRIDRKPHGSVIHGGGSGGGGGGGSSSDNSCFKILKTDGLGVVFANCFCMIGGNFYALGGTVEGIPNCMMFEISEDTSVVSLRIKIIGTEPEFSLFGVKEISKLEQTYAEMNESFCQPLFSFSVDEETETVTRAVDLRNIPIAPTFEFN